MNSIRPDANKRYIGTSVYITTKRKRYVVMDLKSKEMWANEYFKTLESCLAFCEDNGFIIHPSPIGESKPFLN